MVQLLRKNIFLWLFFGVFLLFVFSISTVHAQFEREAGLETTPSHPGPHERVVVDFSLYGVDLFGSTIRWYQNGVELIELKNNRSIEITTGGLGEKTTIHTVATLRSGESFSISKAILPTVVDLILEADTYVPYFYNGRALPSREAEIRAVAVVHDGSNMPDTSYTYKWSLANSTLFGGPIKGKNVAELTMPRYDNKRLRVEVFNNLGESVAKNNILLTPATPELYFYEESPLRGLQEKAVVSRLAALTEEVVVSGEPYYLTPKDLNQTSTEWKIDSEVVYTDQDVPNKLALRRTGEGDATAKIDFEIITNALIPQLVRGVLQVVFN